MYMYTNDYLEPYCTVDSTNHANIPEASRPSPRLTLSFGPKVYEWNRVGGNLEEGAWWVWQRMKAYGGLLPKQVWKMRGVIKKNERGMIP